MGEQYEQELQMQASSEATVEVTVRLTEDEAVWLRDYMQNAHSEPEDPTTAVNRQTLFGALHRALTTL